MVGQRIQSQQKWFHNLTLHIGIFHALQQNKITIIIMTIPAIYHWNQTKSAGNRQDRHYNCWNKKGKRRWEGHISPNEDTVYVGSVCCQARWWYIVSPLLYLFSKNKKENIYLTAFSVVLEKNSCKLKCMGLINR